MYTPNTWAFSRRLRNLSMKRLPTSPTTRRGTAVCTVPCHYSVDALGGNPLSAPYALLWRPQQSDPTTEIRGQRRHFGVRRVFRSYRGNNNGCSALLAVIFGNGIRRSISLGFDSPYRTTPQSSKVHTSYRRIWKSSPHAPRSTPDDLRWSLIGNPRSKMQTYPEISDLKGYYQYWRCSGQRAASARCKLSSEALRHGHG
jgi:hypothetical protein